MVQVGGVGDRTNNLFDVSAITIRKYINANGEEKNSTAEYPENYLNHSDYINISPSQNYIFKGVLPSSYVLANTIAFCWFDINKNIISRNTLNINQTIDNYVMSSTSPENATYLIINFIGLVDGAKFSLNVGSTSLPYEPYGYKVPVVVNGENLFNKNDVIEGSLNPYDGKTIMHNNQLYTKNYIPVTANDVYIISGLDYGIRIHEYNSNHNFIKSYVVNNNNSFTVSNNCAYIRAAGSINRFLDTGMINLGSTSLPYEPYIEETTNIYLDEPIEENESISLSDTNVNVPTLRGTNVLTVDTTVQPSKVYVKVRKESQYETIMRERYEEAQAQLDALESGGE